LLCSTVSSKEERGEKATDAAASNFGFNAGWGRPLRLCYIFVHEILKPDWRKTEIFCFCRYTDPDEPEQKMDYSGEDNNNRTSALQPATNQMVYGYFTEMTIWNVKMKRDSS
jgi:hypothetical protein